MEHLGIKKAVEKFNNNDRMVIFYIGIDDLVECWTYEAYTNYLSPERFMILHNVGEENKNNKTTIEELKQLINKRMEFPFE